MPFELKINGSVLMQYLVRELATHEKRAEWLDMLAQAYELRSLVVDNGGVDVEGALALQPIDYANLAAELQALQRNAAPPQAVSADVVDVRSASNGEIVPI